MLLVKRLMLEKGVSGASLARAARMGESDVSKITRGRAKPYPSQAEKVAAAIGWEGDVNELFEEEKEDA